MPMKPVTQGDLADRLGLDRTTVSKVFNRARDCYVSDRTREKIFALAKKLGFEFQPRASVSSALVIRKHQIPARLDVLLADGKVHASGKALVIDLSQEGALLADLAIEPATLPIAPCYGRLRFRLGDKDFELRCDFQRIGLERFVELGVRFVEITAEDVRDIGRFLEGARER